MIESEDEERTKRRERKGVEEELMENYRDSVCRRESERESERERRERERERRIKSLSSDDFYPFLFNCVMVLNNDEARR